MCTYTHRDTNAHPQTCLHTLARDVLPKAQSHVTPDKAFPSQVSHYPGGWQTPLHSDTTDLGVLLLPYLALPNLDPVSHPA